METSQPNPMHILGHVFLVLVVSSIVGVISFYFGMQTGKYRELSRQLSDKPPIVINSPKTEIDQSTKKAGYMLGLHLGKAWGLGICHD